MYIINFVSKFVSKVIGAILALLLWFIHKPCSCVVYSCFMSMSCSSIFLETQKPRLVACQTKCDEAVSSNSHPEHTLCLFKSFLQKIDGYMDLVHEHEVMIVFDFIYSA
jgi:hypothetical protein